MCKINNLPVNGQGLSKTNDQTTNFTQIANEILLDQRLSFKARGILALLLSRPKNWKIYIDEIVERSNLDGKHAVRTGFKELKALGYLKLVKIWNKETKKFEGTIYQLCKNDTLKSQKSPKKNNQKHTKSTKKTTIQKAEQPKNRPTENLSVEQTDRPKTYTLSNTNSSNTKYSNTKQQQQKADIAVLKNSKNGKTTVNEIPIKPKSITELLPYLQKDENWKKQFIGKNICKQPGQVDILTNKKMELLLQHFAQTSLSSGTTYVNIVGIKRHFFNWFNANLNKKALPSYIEQRTILPQKVRKQVAILIPKTNAILDKIYGQMCNNEAHVYRCLQLLETHLAMYENAVNILDDENKNIVKSWIEDIEHAKELVKRGQKANQINWFCKRKSKQNRTPKPAKSAKPMLSVISKLSQKMAVVPS